MEAYSGIVVGNDASSRGTFKTRYWMKRSRIFVAVSWPILLGAAAPAERIPVRHVQRPMHRLMVARLETGKIIENGEFTQMVEGNEVTMRMFYRFVDGSIDDETTTYKQEGT